MKRTIAVVILVLTTLMTASAWRADSTGGFGIRFDVAGRAVVLHVAEGRAGLRVFLAGSGTGTWRVTTLSSDQLSGLFLEDLLRPVGATIVDWQVPLWIVPSAVVVLWCVLLSHRPVQRYRRRRRGVCVTCAYDFTGNESGMCPECGTDTRR